MSTRLTCDRNQFSSILLSVSLLVVIGGTLADKSLKCDYKKYPNVGCPNADRHVCDQKTQVCRCGPKYPISFMSDICLERKTINESCMASIQCRHIPNAGCYGLGLDLNTEFKEDLWVLLWYRFGYTEAGKCLCVKGQNYEFNQQLNACVRKPMADVIKCRSDSDCSSTLPNTNCQSGWCQCKDGFHYISVSNSCQLPDKYDDQCSPKEGCAGQELVCVKSKCKCKARYHFDKHYSNKCEPNFFTKCLDGDDINDCLEAMREDRSLNKMSEFDLIQPPRIYSIFIILALWICLLFILGNAKKGLRLVEQAVRRDQSSQYRQCDTCIVQPLDESDSQELGLSSMSIQSDVSQAINQGYPPPTFDEIYPNECQSFDDPPTYEEVIQFDKNKGYVV